MNTIPTNKISALIITFNEIGYIEECIKSVSFADEILVVDSFSTDGTYEFLLNHPKVTVIQNKFENFTSQKSFALTKAKNDWVLFLDADEVVPKSLKDEIINTLNKNTEIVAFWFYRQFMFQQEELQYSGWQTDKNYRLFRKSKAKFCDQKIVHETLEVDGLSSTLEEKMIHYCYKNYNDYRSKMLRYGQLKAKEAFFTEKRFSYTLMILKTAWKFLNHYILRLGFLDGKKGIKICYLNALGVLEYSKELKRLEEKNKLAYYLIMP